MLRFAQHDETEGYPLSHFHTSESANDAAAHLSDIFCQLG